MATKRDENGIDPLLPDPNYVKKLLRNTMETYSLPYKALLEALQNAIDSFIIEDGDHLVWGEFEEGHEPKVEVIFSLKNNSITVRDNGVGMDVLKYGFFVLLGASGKDKTLEEITDDGAPSINRRKVKGSQGVGIKSSVFSSRLFKVESVYSTDQERKKWSLELVNYCNYMKMSDEDLRVPHPETQDTEDPTGTSITVIIDPLVKPSLDSVNDEFTVEGFLQYIISEQIQSLGISWNPDKNPLGVPDCEAGYTLNSDRTLCVKDNDITDTKLVDFKGTWYNSDGSGIRIFPPLKADDLIINYLRTQTYVGDITRPMIKQRVEELEDRKLQSEWKISEHGQYEYRLQKQLNDDEIQKDEYEETKEKNTNLMNSETEHLERIKAELASTKEQCTPSVKLIVTIEKAEVVE